MKYDSCFCWGLLLLLLILFLEYIRSFFTCTVVRSVSSVLSGLSMPSRLPNPPRGLRSVLSIFILLSTSVFRMCFFQIFVFGLFYSSGFLAGSALVSVSTTPATVPVPSSFSVALVCSDGLFSFVCCCCCCWFVYFAELFLICLEG